MNLEIADIRRNIIRKFEEINYKNGMILIECIIKQKYTYKKFIKELIISLSINKRKYSFEIYNYIIKKTKFNYETSLDSDNNEIMHYVCANRNINFLKYLINNKANINTLNIHNKTPIYFSSELAIDDESFETTKLLLENGADLSINHGSNSSVLLNSVKSNCFSSLIKKNYCNYNEFRYSPFINTYSFYDKYQLHNQYNEHTIKTIELLLEYSKKDEYLMTHTYDNLLHHMIFNHPSPYSNEFKKILKLFFDNGFDINKKYNPDKETLLMFAVKNEPDYEFIKFLLENNADVNATNIHNDTAFKILIKYGYGTIELCSLLIKYGANPTIKKDI